MPSVQWKITFSVFFFLLWLYAILLCLMDVRASWKGGYGRVRSLLGVALVPPASPAIPLLLLPMLICTKKRQLLLFACSLVVLALSTVCATVTLAVLQERSLQGLDTRLILDLQDKYGHGSTNNHSNVIFTQGMDYAQYTLKCCGINGDKDYEGTNWYAMGASHGPARLVPPSCCVPETLSTLNNISHSGSPINVVSRVFYGMLEEGWQNPQPKHESRCQSKDASQYMSARYTKGCLKLIYNWVREDIIVTLIVDGSLVVLELIGVVLCNTLRKQVTTGEMLQRTKD